MNCSTICLIAPDRAIATSPQLTSTTGVSGPKTGSHPHRIHHVAARLLLMVLLHIFIQGMWASLLQATPRENPGPAAGEVHKPRIGIVISKTSFDHRWGITQMSSHGWTGAVNLAGIPYETLVLEEMTPEDLAGLNALILTQCTYIARADIARATSLIRDFHKAGGQLIVDGPFALYDDNGSRYSGSDYTPIPEITYNGFRGNREFRIRNSDNRHFITRLYERGAFITQHLVGGLNILQYDAGTDGATSSAGNNNTESTGQANATVLLEYTDEIQSYPYLTAVETGAGRLMLVSDFATYSSAPSIFRNADPQVFYKNELFNILVRGIQWVVYGDITGPIPAPQVSNARLTSVIRLDADASGNLDAQIRTMNYLARIARETGVVPLYAWVSSTATRAGWQELAPLGRMLEDLGGRIGTHSRYHRINAEMTPERWVEELDGSIQEIEYNTADYDYPVKGVEYMINPGNTIRMSDYDEVSRRFHFFMTHGFEQDMPIGFGNMTWFTGDDPNFVVINNTPSPDYQWFNDPNWSYTTAQITAYQESIFDHLFNSVGKGIVYNQMWHDYAISTLPQSPKERIVNDNNIAMYDAMMAKFATTDIYAPEPEELGHKIRAMKQMRYEWTEIPGGIRITIDLSGVQHEDIPAFTGGMGLRIDNSARRISRVSLNGAGYYGFDDHTVVLPELTDGESTLEVFFGEHPASGTRLTYTSKMLRSLTGDGQKVRFRIDTKTRGRFALHSLVPGVLRGADFQEWNRLGDYRLNGHINNSREVEFIPSENHGFGITIAEVPVTGFRETRNTAELDLNCPAGACEGAVIEFTSATPPRSVQTGDATLSITTRHGKTSITLPKEPVSKLIIRF
jgi:hypothetical protein